MHISVSISALSICVDLENISIMDIGKNVISCIPRKQFFHPNATFPAV